jgi:hypothetical protein
MPRYKAFALACSQSNNTKGHWESASKLWARSSKVRKRVSELQKQRRKSIDLTADQLLDDLLLNIDLATAAGQHSAAITGIKTLGGEMFSMFTERKENLNINVDLSNIRSNAQLKQYLEAEYGQC